MNLRFWKSRYCLGVAKNNNFLAYQIDESKFMGVKLSFKAKIAIGGLEVTSCLKNDLKIYHPNNCFNDEAIFTFKKIGNGKYFIIDYEGKCFSTPAAFNDCTYKEEQQFSINSSGFGNILDKDGNFLYLDGEASGDPTAPAIGPVTFETDNEDAWIIGIVDNEDKFEFPILPPQP